jgi:hypothetical protein
LIALTSISPRHAIGDAQIKAVESWKAQGCRVISLNTDSEISLLKDRYDIEFVATNQTTEGLYKVPYVLISAFIDHAKSNRFESIMLINSDIILSGSVDKYFEQCKDGLVFANRTDFSDNYQQQKTYPNGFDVFFIHSEYYGLLPKTLFAMGQTWWDYWLPYRFIMSRVQLFLVKDPIFMHERHPVQYNAEEWQRMTRHFSWVENYLERGRPQDINNTVFRLIQAKCK